MSNAYEYGVRDVIIYPKEYDGYGAGFHWMGVTEVTLNNDGGDATYLWNEDTLYESLRDITVLTGSIESITRPPVVYGIDGYYQYECGVLIGQQERTSFGMAYKSEQPEDDEGYLLHLLYNLSLNPAEIEYSTLTETMDATRFKWDFVSVSTVGEGIWPTCEVTISSREIAPSLLGTLEQMLYSRKHFPDIPELIEIINQDAVVSAKTWEPDNIESDFKYGILRTPESLGGTIEAYSYPEAFLEPDGKESSKNGFRVSQQKRKEFSLCYRTEKSNGNYLIHILYNLTVSPAEIEYNTFDDSPDIPLYNWEFLSTPIQLPFDDGKFIQTSEVILDSALIEKSSMKTIEEQLYGSENNTSRLLTPDELVELCSTQQAGSLKTEDTIPVEYGVSKGVLFINGFGHAWSGLVSITTNPQGGESSDIWVTT